MLVSLYRLKDNKIILLIFQFKFKSELEISAFTRRVYLITEDHAKTEERLKAISDQLVEKTKQANESEK